MAAVAVKRKMKFDAVVKKQERLLLQNEGFAVSNKWKRELFAKKKQLVTKKLEDLGAAAKYLEEDLAAAKYPDS